MSAIYMLGKQRVQLGEGCFVADTAVLIGSVILKRNCSVWYHTVLRGDNDLIEIGQDSNIQDGSILHTDKGLKLVIGRGVSIGHQVTLHGCQIGDHTLVGIGSVVLNRVKIGNHCLIAANSLITENSQIPDESVVMGSPAKVIRKVTENEIQNIKGFASRYLKRKQLYLETLKSENDLTNIPF